MCRDDCRAVWLEARRYSPHRAQPPAHGRLDRQISVDSFQIDSIESHIVYSDDLLAKNTFELPNVVVPQVNKYSSNEWADKGSQRPIQKHSFALFIFEESVP